MLTKKKIKELFAKLNQKLEAEGAKGEIGIVGGAVMCLVFNARESTKDVDGIFMPTQKIRKLVKEISEEEGVAEDWFKGKFDKIGVLSLSHLQAWAPQPEYMLAMKCISARIDTKDADDVRFLIRHLKLKSAKQVFDLVTKYYPRMRVPAKAQFFVEEIFENSN